MGENVFIFVGSAEGQFEIQDGPNKGKKQAYCNLWAIYPVSDFESPDYHAVGFRAEKFKCTDPSVFKNLTPGELCKLYFNDKKVVVLAASEGQMVDLTIQ